MQNLFSMSENKVFNFINSRYSEKLEAKYKDVKYYDYDIQVKNGVLTSTVDINYAKIDTDKLIEIDSANGTLIKDGKIKLEDLKSAYETIGASCEG